MRQLIIFLATAAYAGFVPVAPGTAGSAVGLLIVWLAFGPLWLRSWPTAAVVFIGLFIPACWIAHRAEEIFAETDCPKIVIDEVMGMVATMFLSPLGWPHLLAGFVIFRLLDIIKPFPVDLIERRAGGGAAVMLDDLAAAVYANLALRVLFRFI